MTIDHSNNDSFPYICQAFACFQGNYGSMQYHVMFISEVPVPDEVVSW